MPSALTLSLHRQRMAGICTDNMHIGLPSGPRRRPRGMKRHGCPRCRGEGFCQVKVSRSGLDLPGGEKAGMLPYRAIASPRHVVCISSSQIATERRPPWDPAIIRISLSLPLSPVSNRNYGCKGQKSTQSNLMPPCRAEIGTRMRLGEALFSLSLFVVPNHGHKRSEGKRTVKLISWRTDSNQ